MISTQFPVSSFVFFLLLQVAYKPVISDKPVSSCLYQPAFGKTTVLSFSVFVMDKTPVISCYVHMGQS